MMKKVSIKSIKLPITKRNHRQQIAQDKVRENGDFENKDDEADLGHADHGLKQRNASSVTTVDKASRKGKTSFLKSLRKKLVSRHRPRETSEPIPEDTEIAFNTMSGNKGSKQTKSKGQNMRSVCPMPSPVRSTNMSGNKIENEFQKSTKDSNNSEATSNTNHSQNGSGSSSSSLEGTTQSGAHAQTTDRSRAIPVEKIEPQDVKIKTSPGSINASFENQKKCNGDDSLSETGCHTYESCEISQHAITPMYDSVIETPKMRSLTRELFKLSNCGWYWGPITRVEAEEKLANQADGAFLVRDSSDDRYLLSLSFRSYGKTLHTRIEHCNGMFSFYAQSEPEGHSSIVDLIEHSMNYSQSGVFCYSRARMPGSPSFPVRLTKPISRFTQVRSLQYLCRFVIRLYIRRDNIEKLPLPSRIKGYIEEGHY